MPTTNYLEGKLLDHLLNTATYTAPTSLWLALFTVVPARAGGGTESTGGSYARQEVAWSSLTQDETGTETVSSVIETFTAMPASTLVASGIFDASTAGNLLFYKVFDTSVVVAAGEDVYVSAGNASIKLA